MGELGKSSLPWLGAISSAGRAARLHRVGRRFDPVIAHQAFESIEHSQYFHEIDPLCSTELVHQTVSEQSNSSLESITKASTAGITDRYHQNADSRFTRLFGNRTARPSQEAAIKAPRHSSGSVPGIETSDVAFAHGQPSPSSYGSKSPSINGRRRPPHTASNAHNKNGLSSSLRNKHGMFAKGRSLYVRWKIPKRFQSIIGRTHFVRSLKTGTWADAVRMVRIVGIEFENMLRQAEGVPGVAYGLSERTPAQLASIAPKNNGITLEQAFAMFVSDPSKNRAQTTMMRYHEIMPVVYEVIAPTTPVRQIDRAMCRRFLEMIQWLPANATKRFPNVSTKEICERAKSQKIKRLLSPQTINFYMVNLTAVLNFAVNEEWMDKNPAKGLRVADPVRAKDKRLPYSNEQLQRIFSTSIYTTESARYRDTAKFWVPLIGLFGLRLNETAGLLTEHIQTIEGITCFVIKETEVKSLKTTASERIVPIATPLERAVSMKNA